MNVEIGASSVDTAMTVNDEHLRGDEFFDIERHLNDRLPLPGSDQVAAAGRYTVHGELTIREITQPVRLVVDVFGACPRRARRPGSACGRRRRCNQAVWDITSERAGPGRRRPPWRTTSTSSSTCRWCPAGVTVQPP